MVAMIVCGACVALLCGYLLGYRIGQIDGHAEASEWWARKFKGRVK